MTKIRNKLQKRKFCRPLCRENYGM